MKISVCYMVAGMSSRFGGKIKQFAKVGVNGETLIEVSIKQAISAGFNEIIFIVGEKTEAPFKEMFGNSYKGVPVKYARQSFDITKRDKPWGTTDAILSAKEFLDSPFVVCNGDDIYGVFAFKELHRHLINSSDCAAVGYILDNSLPDFGTVNRGIFRIADGYVDAIEETFKISRDNLPSHNLSLNDLCSMNIFALTPNVVLLLEDAFENFKEIERDSRTAEALLPSHLSDFIQKGLIKMKIYPTSEKCIGVTNPEDEEKVRELLTNNS